MTARRVTERQQVPLEICRDRDEKPPWEEWAAQFLRVPREGLSDLVRKLSVFLARTKRRVGAPTITRRFAAGGRPSRRRGS